MSNDRIIHPYGETLEISEEEDKKWHEPYEQHKELYDSLTAWGSHAIEVLKAHGYTEFHASNSKYGILLVFQCIIGVL